MNETKYSAFISYSHTDEMAAKWLQRALETYRLPRHVVNLLGLDTRRLNKLFRDRDELGSAASLSALIQSALDKSAALIVICSPSAMQSQWVEQEIVYFRSCHPQRPVLPIVVEGDPEAMLPNALRFRISQDAQISDQEDEPLVVTLDEGLATARLRIVAGLLGISFDDLRRRDVQRRHRRLLVIASVSLAGMVLSSALAGYALLQRDRAEREKAVSEQVTDFLIDLFKASDPYSESGADLTATELLDRGAQKISSGLHQDPVLRSRLLATIGEVYTELALYDNAERYLNEALVTQQALLDADGEQILRLGIARAWLAIETGNFQVAQDIYDELLPELRKDEALLSVVPAEADWATLLNDLGVLQWSIGNYAEAITTLEQSLELNTQIHGLLNTEVALNLQNLGLALQDAGQLERARQTYERAVAMQIELNGPDHPLLTITYANLASTVRRLNDFEAAKSYLTRGLSIAEASFEDDHPAIASLSNGLGIVLFKLEDFNGALEQLNRAGSIWLKLHGPGNSSVAANLQHRARVFEAIGNLNKARELYEQSMRAYIDSKGAEHPDIAGVYLELAELLEKFGEIDEARRLFSAAEKIVTEKFPATHSYVQVVTKRHREFLVRNTDTRGSPL